MTDNIFRRDVLRATSTASVLGLASQTSVAATSEGTTVAGVETPQSDIHVSNDGTASKQITVQIIDTEGSDVLFTRRVTLPGLNADKDVPVERTQATVNVDATGDGRYVAEAMIPGGNTAQTEVVMTRFGLARNQRILVSVGPGGDVTASSYFR